MFDECFCTFCTDPFAFFLVGYSKDDVLYRWTKGRGVNIASDMKLSQFDLIQTPTGNANTIVNKGLTLLFLICAHILSILITF